MRKILALFAIALFIISVGSCQRNKGDVNSLSAGDSAPDFTLSDINGNTVSLSANRGKVVIVEFWAMWCPPCRDLTPGLIEIQEKYKDKKFAIFALTSEDENNETIKSFIKEYGLTYPVVLADSDTINRYNVDGIPVSFLIDKEGKIASKHMGNTPGLVSDLSLEIERLL